MSILFFDVSYSGYSQRLAQELERKLDLPCYAILSNRALSVYATKLKRRYPFEENSQQDAENPSTILEEIGNINCVNQYNWSEEEVRRAKAISYCWLKRLFKELQPRLCVFFTDQRLLNAVGIYFCRKHQVPYVVLEDGAFRPWTISLDCLGVNRYSSFLQRPHDPYLKLNDVLKEFETEEPRKKEHLLYSRFAYFLLLNRLDTCVFRKNRAYKHKSYDPVVYFKVLMRNILASRRHSNLEKLEKQPEEKIIFLPLQLPTDTQLLGEKGFEGNQKLIDDLLEAIKGLKISTRLFIKKHPRDVSDYDYRSAMNADAIATEELIKKSDLVVVINSTVGLEAIVENTPCVCLGESFYTKPEYVYKANLESKESIKKAMEVAMKQGAKIDGDIIKANILKYYQGPGSFFNYSNQDVEKTAGLILKRTKLRPQIAVNSTVK